MGAARHRLTGARRAGPVRLSTPYRGTFSPPYNAASKLTIPTPNGYGAMHPDVVDFGPSGWHGHRYWMAFTPYNGDEQTEIPSVVTSDDLATWAVPAGYTNPLTADQSGATHMADTDLVYDAAADLLHVFYVVTDNSTFFDIRSKSTPGDGSWSSEVVVLATTGNTGMTNPSVVNTAAGWRMYYTRGAGVGGKLVYYRDTTADPSSGYGAEVACTVTLDANRMCQNINAAKDIDGSVVLIVSDSNDSTVNGRMYFARSADGGVTFTATGPPMLEGGPSGAWDEGGIYRASLVVDTDSTVVESGTNLHLFYSGYRDGTSTWGTGYVQIPAQFIRT